MFISADESWPVLASTPAIDALIASGAPIAIGVSGGKDSQCAALETFSYLNALGHRGPRLLVHSDLGVVEWNASLGVCQTLAAHLGCELMVLRRSAGDLMDRWEARWRSSVRRYAELSTVTLVLPWSTPRLRFCTSELKTHLIGAALRRRFKGQVVMNVTGIRREESAERARTNISSWDRDGKLIHWRPICDWTLAQVFERIARSGLALHPAYTEYCMRRVSCRFCIMSSLHDLLSAAAAPEAHALYRRMVALEIESTFAFQGVRWLGDIAPALLSAETRTALEYAKQKSAARIALESAITPEMRFENGRPTRPLTDAQATLLASVRRQVSSLVGIKARYLDAASIHERYAQLMKPRSHPIAA